MQLKVVKEVKAFFNSLKNESDDEMEDSDSDEDSGDEEGGVNGDYAGFFLKLFEENGELRGFYEKNYENGEFGCLVCGGVGFIRRFKDCVALVQHTVSISKTKKMKAHRAFGQVVCEVLGWDINKLPSSIGEKKNAISSKSNERIVSNEGDNGDEETGEKESAGGEVLPVNGALAVAEIIGDGSSIAAKVKENAPVVEQGNIEGSLGCLEAGPQNGTKNACRDVEITSVNEKSPAETKGKEAPGNEILPISDVSNLAQSLQSVSAVGRNPNYLLEETLNGKRENAESSSICVEPCKEDGSGKNESADKQ